MSNHYRYILKNSDQNRFNTNDSVSAATSQYGTMFKQDLPATASIAVHFYPNEEDPVTIQYGSQNRTRLKTLESLFARYRKYSNYFQYSSSVTGVDFDKSNICLINIPSIFYGDTIDKGSVKLSTFKNGMLLARLEDINRNGELIETISSEATSSNTGSIAGVIMYDEGLIALFGSGSLAEYSGYTENFYSAAVHDSPRWINWGLTLNLDKGDVVSSSYDIEFSGVNKIPQLTMLAHAPKGEMNYSTNYTFTDFDDTKRNIASSGSTGYSEPKDVALTNITKTEYASPVPDYHKETYISKICIYDENKKIIGVAKLAKPVRKTENRDFTFKLAVDL